MNFKRDYDIPSFGFSLVWTEGIRIFVTKGSWVGGEECYCQVYLLYLRDNLKVFFRKLSLNTFTILKKFAFLQKFHISTKRLKLSNKYRAEYLQTPVLEIWFSSQTQPLKQPSTNSFTFSNFDRQNIQNRPEIRSASALLLHVYKYAPKPYWKCL